LPTGAEELNSSHEVFGIERHRRLLLVAVADVVPRSGSEEQIGPHPRDGLFDEVLSVEVEDRAIGAPEADREGVAIDDVGQLRLETNGLARGRPGLGEELPCPSD